MSYARGGEERVAGAASDGPAHDLQCQAVRRAKLFFFFFQAEDGIRDLIVTGVQTCALPIWNIAQFCVNPEVAVDSARRLAGGETLRNVEIRMRHRDGSIRHGLLSANALFEDRKSVV